MYKMIIRLFLIFLLAGCQHTYTEHEVRDILSPENSIDICVARLDWHRDIAAKLTAKEHVFFYELVMTDCLREKTIDRYWELRRKKKQWLN